MSASIEVYTYHCGSHQGHDQRLLLWAPFPWVVIDRNVLDIESRQWRGTGSRAAVRQLRLVKVCMKRLMRYV